MKDEPLPARRRINEEHVSVDSLKHALISRFRCREVHIDPVEHDPPDFIVTADGETFPAEVTSIVSLQEYNAKCDDFAKAIRDRADSAGVLFGKYALIITRLPHIPRPASKNGHQLLDTIVSYINATQQREASPELQLTRDNLGEISIAKLSADGLSIGVLWTPLCMWEGDIQSQLVTLIQHAVDDKRRKLQNAKVGPQKALLLLYDAFAYAEPIDAFEAMRQVNGYEWFHSIFWVASFTDRKNQTYPEDPGRNGFFLFSINPTWNDAARR